jgi:hypothetical protein
MKAYELMALAASEPEKYEGKKYKAVSNANGETITAYDGVKVGQLSFEKGVAYVDGNDTYLMCKAHISCGTELELVPEPPKPISVEEAAKASMSGKTIICKYPDYNNPLNECTCECRSTEAYLTFHMINTAKWYIKEE